MTITSTDQSVTGCLNRSFVYNNQTFQPTRADFKRFEVIDRELQRFVVRGAGTAYDSVVIAGAGFSATIMAARLARSPQFHGKVVLAGPRATESRRLKDGATLRGTGADYICYALGVPQSEYISALYGPIIDGRGVGTRNLGTLARKIGPGRFELSRVFPWQGGKSGYPRPLFFGARNSRMQGAMHELMDLEGVIESPDPITSIEQACALAPGKRPLIVNAGHNQRLLGANVPKVDWSTAAVQAPLRIRPSGLRHISSNAALIASVRHSDNIDVTLFNPFADPLSPQSSFYAIIIKEVTPGAAGFNKDHQLGILTEQLHGIADTLGMDVDDPDETFYSGLIPGSPWTAVASAPGTLELQMIAHPGVSGTFSDGMTSGAMAAVAAAEAVILGGDPDASARRAVREVDHDRRSWHLVRNRIPKLTDLAIRTFGEAAFYYPHTMHAASTWATKA